MSLSLIVCYPTGREDIRRFQLGFNELALNIPHRDLVRVDPGDLSAQANVRPRTLKQVIKLLVRSCHRWQLKVCSWIYEVIAPRHAPQVS